MRQHFNRHTVVIFFFVFMFFSSAKAMPQSASAQALLSTLGITQPGFDKARALVARAQQTRDSQTDSISIDLANTLIIHHNRLQSPFSQSALLPSKITILLFNPQPQVMLRLSSALNFSHLSAQNYLGIIDYSTQEENYFYHYLDSLLANNHHLDLYYNTANPISLTHFLAVTQKNKTKKIQLGKEALQLFSQQNSRAFDQIKPRKWRV